MSLLTTGGVSVGYVRKQRSFEKENVPFLAQFNVFTGDARSTDRNLTSLEPCIIGDVIGVTIDLEPYDVNSGNEE